MTGGAQTLTIAVRYKRVDNRDRLLTSP